MTTPAFRWIELATSELTRAQRYYERLLDWKPQSMGLTTRSGAAIHYQCFRLGEHVVAGLYEHVAGPQAIAGGPHWKGYVAVADADASFARALALGARAILPPLELLHYGRLALFADPQAAVVGIWQPRGSDDALLARDRLGLLRWMELASPDPRAALRFYEQLFGWRARVVDFGRGEYWVLDHAGQEVGGIAGPQQPHGRSGARWIPYFEVAACAALSERAANLLGELVTPATRVEGLASYAVLRDPQGAVFGFFTPEPAESSVPAVPPRAPA